MKRINSLMLMMALMFSALAMGRWAYAASPYAVTVSTVVPTAQSGAAALTTAGYPNITGNVAIRKIWLSNDGASEVVNVWKLCASTTTAALVWTGVVPGTTTAATNGGVLQMDSLPNTFVVTSPCFSKGLAGSGTVKIHVEYQ